MALREVGMPLRRSPNFSWKLGAMGALLIAVVATACGSNGGDLSDTGGNGSANDGGGGAICAPGKAGCRCSSDGQQAACGEVTARDGNYVTCSEGTSTCHNGSWGPCVSQFTTFKSVGPLGAGGITTQDLSATSTGDAGACASDPCDPTCQTFIDNSNGVDAAGLQPIPDGGWTLPLGEGGTCQGLQCQIPYCGGGQATTVTGTVYDPAALNPVYNAVVMIPNGTVQPIPAGVSSDPCGGAPLPLAVTYTTSAIDGTFTLTNVPVGTSIPLVIQIGRWRRVVNIDTSMLTCGSPPLNISANCSGSNNYGTAPTSTTPGAGSWQCLTRLPRVQSEGNIPHIAIATGGLDAIECTLYRMGVSSTEFSDEQNQGRIHVFNDGGAVLPSPNANHDASYLLGFTCPGAKCPPVAGILTNITNNDFETGDLTGWTSSGVYESASNAIAYNGKWSAQVGASTATNSGDSAISQTFTAPTGVGTLSFWDATFCQSNNVKTDWFAATVTDNTAGTTWTISPVCPKTQCSKNYGCSTSWNHYLSPSTFVVPGHSYTFTATNHNGSASPTTSFVDYLEWLSAVPNILPNYDLVMLPCNGGGEYNSSSWGYSYDDPGRVNLVNYAAAGGRVFTSHWGREWIERTSAVLPNGPFPGVANWIGDFDQGSTDNGVINTATTYGQNFDNWLVAVGAATAGGSITINPARYDTSSVTSASRLFVTFQSNGDPADFTFDTPVGSSTPAGRVMYTDMHLANGQPFGTFPSNCPTQGTALLQQEDAAEYLLFDLGACVSGSPLPPPATYTPATFTRDFQGTCPSGYRVVWRYFYWEDATPSDSNIVFTGWTADTEAQLGMQYPSAPLATASGPDACPAGPSCTSSFIGVDVDPELAANGTSTSGNPAYASHSWLRVNMTLNPSSDQLTAPVLLAWQQTYDCVAAE